METERQASMKIRWERAVHECDLPIEGASSLFQDLSNRYAESHRHYHNLDHIEHCLLETDALPVEVRSPEFEVALWFHDAVYDPERHDNEAASAALARTALGRLGWNANSLADVERLILATDHRDLPSRPDEALIVDIDLAILGQPESVYDNYAAAIRKEYGHVPESAYRQGRAAVLRGFLGRKEIFSTTGFRQRFEAQARQNLARELESLG